jgi:uncharacterized protein (TIGR03067 family)
MGKDAVVWLLVLQREQAQKKADRRGTRKGAADVSNNQFAELQGTWVIVKMEMNGKSLLKKDEKWQIVVEDGKGSFIKPDGAKGKPMHLAKVLDSSRKPKTVTAAYEDKLTFYGIYEVKGDELRVCGDGVDTATEKNPEARRPRKFDSKEGLLFVFKRAKDRK